jgi:sugar lactone lactonase YvrE
LDWLNVDRPLTLGDLRGKIVLLDFWTYGCINCMHVIPELKELETKYADELVVIGVHSAKFDNEGQTENIRRIIQRYELEHPVINDSDFAIWNTYGARAWPTFVLIDPRGNVVGQHAGEGIYDLFDRVVSRLVAEFDDEIDRSPLALVLERERMARSPLLFPGKVLADAAGERLFIADSNHNRIVVTDLDGVVQAVIGSGLEGLEDGRYTTARFFRPQGLALADGDTLYVADTGNHVLRRIDLVREIVQTVAGTGDQVYTQLRRGDAGSTPLNSPWDLYYQDGLLYVAMAGQHQVWVYDPAQEEVQVFAGSGREQLLDGPRLEGGLNQPSGLAGDGDTLYVADSEASAIRAVGLGVDGALETIVGTGLFDFGDEDGVGPEVRLQHPLGVVYAPDGLLYVADTYNSKIKTLDPRTGEARTFLGGARAGWRDGVKPLFAEPGGVSLAEDILYVADTNNHVIRAVDLNTRETQTLVLVDEGGLLTRHPPGEYGGRVITLPPQTVGAGEGTLRLAIELPAGYKVNDLAPFSMDWDGLGDVVTLAAPDVERTITAPAFPLDLSATFAEGETGLTGDLVVYYCEEEAQQLCLIEQVRLTVPVAVEGSGKPLLTVAHVIADPQAP